MFTFKYITFLLLLTTTLHAQNPRIETAGNRRTVTYPFKRGVGDSVCFVIEGMEDTAQTTRFYRNGHSQYINWRKDSSYFFNEIGEIKVKKFGHFGRLENCDSIVQFHLNGKISKIQMDKMGVLTGKDFNYKGLLVYEKQSINTPSVFREKEIDQNGVLIKSLRIDTLLNEYGIKETTSYDTLFYETGQPFRITKGENQYFNYRNFYQYFNRDGSIFNENLPDSSRLIIFKDNVNCYYGLKNKRGDTIVQPHYDRIEDDLISGLKTAYQDKYLSILRSDGSIMPSPLQNLTNLYSLNKIEDRSIFYKSVGLGERVRQSYLKDESKYLVFTDNKKYGVMTTQGAIVIPPQYLEIHGKYIDDGKYFRYSVWKKDSFHRLGYINREGKPIFSERFKGVEYTEIDDYFITSEKAKATLNNDGWNESPILGLGTGTDGKILLEPKFYNIHFLPRASLFYTIFPTKDNLRRTAIFNPKTHKWLSDTTLYNIKNQSISQGTAYFVLENIKTHKLGIIDTTGKQIVSVTYDTILKISDTIYLVKRSQKYHLLIIINGKANLHQPFYEYLRAVIFTNSDYSIESIYYFLAKRNGKWGLIDANDKVLKPFDYDYAANDANDAFLLIKNNLAALFTLKSFPNEIPEFSEYRNSEYIRHQLKSFDLADNPKRVFFINDTLKVVIPPQYSPVEAAPKRSFESIYYEEIENGLLVEDDQKKKKIIFFETNTLIDYPFDYRIYKAEANSPFIIVRDTIELGFGVVSTKGKLLIPPINYGVAKGYRDQSYFFVKQDTPFIKPIDRKYNGQRVNSDTLNIEDNNWLMYNSDGKKLRDELFRFPIDFKEGIGIGMIGEDFNLFKTDGTILKPFGKNNKGVFFQDYNNIRRDKLTGFYILYKNQGMTPILLLTKPSGEILVSQGKYDGISDFFGKYAVVTNQNLVGLIDSFGNEVIALQDLFTYKNQFLDSIYVHNKRILHIGNDFESSDRNEIVKINRDSLIDMPLLFSSFYPEFHPDSLNIPSNQRIVLKNLIFEKSLSNWIFKANDLNIPRISIKETAQFLEYERNYNPSIEPLRVSITDSLIGFALRYRNTNFYNFHLHNNIWTEIKPNTLLNLVGEKRQQMNDLLIKKVKALKDVKIDCTNISEFVTQVENCFIVTKDGLDFCFHEQDRKETLVPVSFTWAELQPFLKMKIQ